MRAVRGRARDACHGLITCAKPKHLALPRHCQVDTTSRAGPSSVADLVRLGSRSIQLLALPGLNQYPDPVQPSASDITKALAEHPWYEMPALPGRRNHIRAPILIPLLWTDRLNVICTLRAAHLRYHGGEICFPGGRPEPEDTDLFATALREANEEVGISGGELLGRLSSIPLYTSDYRLEPFVAEVPRETHVANPKEVAEVVYLDIEDLVNRDSVDAIPFEKDGLNHLSPVFQIGDHWMYGGTAFSFYEFLVVVSPLFGQEVPELTPCALTWEDVLPAEFLVPIE